MHSKNKRLLFHLLQSIQLLGIRSSRKWVTKPKIGPKLDIWRCFQFRFSAWKINLNFENKFTLTRLSITYRKIIWWCLMQFFKILKASFDDCFDDTNSDKSRFRSFKCNRIWLIRFTFRQSIATIWIASMVTPVDQYAIRRICGKNAGRKDLYGKILPPIVGSRKRINFNENRSKKSETGCLTLQIWMVFCLPSVFAWTIFLRVPRNAYA